MHFIHFKDKHIIWVGNETQMMIRGCNRSQVCGEHLNVFHFSFSRQQRFKCLITVIPKPSWGVWFIPQRQIAHTDFRFRSHSLTWSLLLKNLSPGFYQIHIRPARGFLFVCSCFRWNVWAREKTAGILVWGVSEPKNKKSNTTTQKRAKGCIRY